MHLLKRVKNLIQLSKHLKYESNLSDIFRKNLLSVSFSSFILFFENYFDDLVFSCIFLNIQYYNDRIRFSAIVMEKIFFAYKIFYFITLKSLIYYHDNIGKFV